MQRHLKSLLMLLPLVLASCGEAQKKVVEYPFHDFDSYQYRAFYSDSYFGGESTNADGRLASLAISMALISRRFLSKEEPRETKYASDFLQAIEMNNIYFSPSYYERPTEDSIAYGFASKRIADGHNLVWAFVCSEGYGAEWVSNFRIGESGDANGFADAAATIVEGLEDYVVDKGLEGRTSLLITGYSRGAAVANLVGGNLDDAMNLESMSLGKATLSFKDTYTYCIETPSGSISDNPKAEKYANIHNYLSFNDPIPMIAPESWGFHRLGQDHFYSDRLTDIRYEERRALFLKTLDAIVGKKMDYPDSSWKSDFDKAQEAHPSYGRYLCATINEGIGKLIGLRAIYAEKYQSAMGKTIHFFIEDVRAQYLVASIKTHSLSLAGKLGKLFEVIELIKIGDYADAKAEILAICDEIFEDDGQTKNIVEYLFNMMSPLFPIISNAYAADPDFDGVTFIMNFASVSYFHARFTTAAWIMTSDEQYGYGGTQDWYNDGTYCRLVFDSECDVTMTLTSGETLFQSAYGEIVSSLLSAEIDPETGTTSIFLPKKAAYQYEASDSVGISLYDVDSSRAETLRQKNLPAKGSLEI